MADSQLSVLIAERVAVEAKVGRRAAEVAHAWLTKHNREQIPVDDERSLAMTDDRREILYGSGRMAEDEIDDIDAAIGNLPVTVFSREDNEPWGDILTLAALTEYLAVPTASAADEAGKRVEKTVTVTLTEIVNSDYEAFLDLITERAYGPRLASDINADIVGYSAQTLRLAVSAELADDAD